VAKKGGKKPPPADFFNGLKLRLFKAPQKLASLRQFEAYFFKRVCFNPKNQMAEMESGCLRHLDL